MKKETFIVNGQFYTIEQLEDIVKQQTQTKEERIKSAKAFVQKIQKDDEDKNIAFVQTVLNERKK